MGLRRDAPDGVRAATRVWLRDEAVNVQDAALAKLREWTPDVGRFLHQLHAESGPRLARALSMLRREGASVAWRDVSRIGHRDLVVRLELIGLFNQRTDEAPLSFWLESVPHVERIHELLEREAMAAVARALWARSRSASSPAPLDEDELAALH